MKKGQFNLLVKPVDDEHAYIIVDMIATKLSKAQCEHAIEVWDKLKGYRFVAYKDTDFSWWQGVRRKLTYSDTSCMFRLREAYFDIDWYGNVSEY